jgi:eukaryotic-like serine/threonine-protein kinase
VILRRAVPFTGTIVLLILSCSLCASVAVQATALDDDWPMYQHDTAHTGKSGSSISSAPALLWSYPFNGGISYSPVIANGYIYFSASTNNENYTLYALNATTGTQEWSAPNGGSAPPAIANGYAYTPSFAYNASTGKLVLSYSNYHGLTPPMVAEDTVYFGFGYYFAGGGVFALNAISGEKLWNYSGIGGVNALALAEGIVYFGSGDFNFYALNASTGKQVWNVTKIGNTSAFPTIANGYVYFCGYASVFYCLDALTGALVWSYPTNLGGATPAISNGYVYYGSYAFNASMGNIIWNNTDLYGSSVAISDGTIYQGSYNYAPSKRIDSQDYEEKIFAFNASTGAQTWNYSFPNENDVGITSPAIANGIIYIGARNGLYAFGIPTITPTLSPSLSSSPSPTPTAVLTIKSSPSVPEFPSWIILPLSAIATLTFFYFKKKNAPINRNYRV